MRNLKARLIRLGEESPELQEDIAPILEEIEEAEKEGYVNGDYGDQSLNRSFYPEEGHIPDSAIGVPARHREASRGMRRFRRANRGGEQFEIIIESISALVEEDDFERGVIGRPFHKEVGRGILETARSPKEFFKILGSYGLPEDPKDYVAFEEGRIDTNVLENSDGFPASRREEEDWKAGRLKLYIANYSVYFKIARVTRPSPEEITSTFGVPLY